MRTVAGINGGCLALLMLFFAHPGEPYALQVQATIPEDVGIYAISQGAVKELQAEAVEAHRSGLFGLDGKIGDPRSSLRLFTPQEFIIRAPDGYSAPEYRLLKLEEKKDHRQFRALTVHVGGATDNASKNSIPFTAQKIASQTWRVQLNLGNGEYAFFSPQMHSEGLGKSLTYTFGVDSTQGQANKVPNTTLSPPNQSQAPSGSIPQGTSASAVLGVKVRTSEQAGAEIIECLPNSPLQMAGLQVGDVITAIDLKPIRTVQDLDTVVENRPSNATIRIGYLVLEKKLWWVQKEVVVNVGK